MSKSYNVKSFSIGVGSLVIMGSLGFYVGWTSNPSSYFNPNAPVAKVGSSTITKSDLYNYLVQSYGKPASDQMVINKIIALDAKENNVQVSSTQVNNELTQVELGYGGLSALNTALQQQGKTLSGLKSTIVTYLQMQALVGSTIHISNSQINSYFDLNKSTYNTPEEVRASNILVSSKSLALQLESKLNSGENFAYLAKKYSIDSTSAKSGGDLGYFTKSSMVPAFANVAFSLPVGKVSSPVKTQYGWNILKVTDIQPATVATLASVKSKVVAALKAQEIQSKYPSWLLSQEKKFNVVDTLDPNIILESQSQLGNSSTSTQSGVTAGQAFRSKK